ncbi:MAG: hypothetical protein U0031_19100 [Thermomicrobiales bacterium]
MITRRQTLQVGIKALAPGVAGAATPVSAGAAKRKRKPRKTLCEVDGGSCKTKSKTCQASNCLTAPFTVEAQWTGPNKLYAVYFFTPNGAGYSAPNAYITSTRSFACTPEMSDCEDNVYPFICFNQEDSGTGPAIMTVRQLLKGKYEYWIYVINNAPAGDLSVTLRDAKGIARRTLSSPENTSAGYLSWHVFDIDGATGSVKSVKKTNLNGMPGGAHSPNTNACPGGIKS